jgi:hypothetical protein
VVCNILQRYLDSLSTYLLLQAVEDKNKRGQDPGNICHRCWSPRKLPTAHIRVGGHPISWSTEVKYLGVTLDKRLAFAGDTARFIEKSENTFVYYIHFSIESRSSLCIIKYYFTKRAFARFYVMGLKTSTTVPIHTKRSFR